MLQVLERSPFHITDSVEEAIEGCKLIMVVTPAFAHEEIARSCARHLEDGQIIVLNPGRTGGAMEFYKIVREINPEIRVTVAEAQTLIYACRRKGESEVVIHGTKKTVSLAALPSRETPKVLEEVNKYYPQFTAAENVLETSLLNIGAIFHPTPSLFNMGRIECQDDFKYYIEGITPSIAKILERLDDERVRIAKMLDVKTLTTREWLKAVYDVENEDMYSTIQMNEVYANIGAPKEANTRYITEDIPMSLLPLAELGRLVGVLTPTMDEIIDLASTMHNKNYRKEGRNLSKLGIDNMTVDELTRYVDEGSIN
ncbi:opine dehydrogenase [Dethiosulfatibacter aminovorans DSM 17477]|uniref:Opine dehydrogenase n=1 Tax=Dethiosulfatibacter aminovorans DSM 17477 TaxID=1121476 RepID=A0A1M6I4L4_9FIRM|nr:NAD/NADP octopine/nopaline dehydrogenase family protein [Dethiosulfatibacter aminovorans]SHJ29373.1 opine dehydrogenase [Dethiosulfatibacter aminovorans DSM 17477]